MTQPTVTGRAWGASPQEWVHFADTLELCEDLLPVVSNPNAVISPNSKMRRLGKTPSRYNYQHEVVGIPNWAAMKAKDSQVARWMGNADYGICIQTRRIRALDIDIPDPVAARRVREFIELTDPGMAVRMRADTGKLLMAFRMEGLFAKRVIRTKHGAIEFLATGQQFIAVGHHVDSGTRYEWEDGLPERFPEMSPAEFEALWSGLAAAFALPDGDVRTNLGKRPLKPRVAADADQDANITWLRENGWIKNFGPDGRVNIRCPWEHEHTMDSGPSATTYFPAGVGGFEQGHFHCLHAHCAHRTDGDFLEALGMVAEEFEDVSNLPVEVEGEEPNPENWPVLLRDKQGRIESTARNLEKALDCPDLCKARLAHDKFKDTTMVCFEGDDAWRPFKDTDNFRLRVLLERRGFKGPPKDLVRDAVDRVAEHHEFDSAIDWANSLEWDGVPRIATFAHRYWGTEDTPYARALSMYAWTALAARALVPGAKCDMVPVLVGDQGIQKTEGIAAMAPEPDAFVEIDLQHRDADLARVMRGKLVAELAELRGLQSREAEAIKSWINRRFEEWTPKYREYATKYPRRVVMFGSTNRDDFLDDPTGERRWLPVHVGWVDREAIERDRDQLWAEGVALFREHGVMWKEAQRLAAREHHKFKAQDPWMARIEEWLEDDDMDSREGDPRWMSKDGWTSAQILSGALGLRADHLTRAHDMRLNRIMAELGFERYRPHRGTRKWVMTPEERQRRELT